MKFRLFRASGRGYYDPQEIEINTLEELIDLIQKEGHGIVIDLEGIPTGASSWPNEHDAITIYDDYLE